MAGTIAELKVKLTVEAVEQSPALRELIKQLIREELGNLDNMTATRLTTQVTKRITRAINTRR